MRSCDVTGCSSPARWRLYSFKTDGDLLECLCEVHWEELKSYSWSAACAYWPATTLTLDATSERAERVRISL